MKSTLYLFSFLSFLLLAMIVSPAAEAQRGRGGRYYRPTHRPIYRPTYRPSYRYSRGYYPRTAVRVGLSVGYRPAYYYSRPFVGVRIGVLPMGYRTIYVGPNPYYYHNGTYYRQYDNYYRSVAPPLGAVVNALPPGAKATVIDGEKYYEFNGTYYRDSVDENNRAAFEVVGTDGVLNTQQDAVYEDQVGDIVDQLPADCRTIQLNGVTYYLSPAGKYYQQKKDGENNYYEVVGTAEEAPAQ